MWILDKGGLSTHRYSTILAPLKHGKMIEAVKGRDKELSCLSSSFRKDLKEVKEIVIDMWEVFCAAAGEHCSQVRATVDRFHVVKKVGKTLDNCRKRLQREGKTKERLRGIRKLLFQPSEELNSEDQERIKAVLAEYSKAKEELIVSTIIYLAGMI